MKMTAYLFMGGPWHTQTREVPDGNHTIRIATPKPLSAIFAQNPLMAMDATPMIEYSEYHLKTFAWTDQWGVRMHRQYFQYASPKV